MVKRREEMVRLTRLNLNGTVFKEDLFQIKLQKPQTYFQKYDLTFLQNWLRFTNKTKLYVWIRYKIDSSPKKTEAVAHRCSVRKGVS